jgi:hypothetical protein
MTVTLDLAPATCRKYDSDTLLERFGSTWTVTSRFLRLRHCKSLIQLRRSRPSENV